jgi:tetratricopeptide (TPR) repeat protein/tRNA A-37 threonylcarbamoyl transferase component Bud32/TolB-like protein
MKCPFCQFEIHSGVHFCEQCGASLRPEGRQEIRTATFQMALLKELPTGSTFAGRYQVIEELGKGGMGRVYKVFDEKIKEKVALKLLKPEISSDGASIERFSNELRFARKISHRHVCRMFDLGEVEGTHYITMEYVPGEDLKSILRMMGPMSAGKVVLIARQAGEGLAEAHRLGVVHRDLKPQNIMIDREGAVRIMDFGIARSMKVKGLTGAGVVIGTPEYMSPEQIEGQEVDNRSDIYSLGIILYEMATGRVPFEGDTFLSVALKQKTEQPQNPKELNSQIPDDLNRLILRCLEKSKEKRYQKVEDLLTDLDTIEKAIPTTEKIIPAVKPSTSREITVKLQPRKLIFPAAGLIVLVAAAIFGLRLFSHKKSVAAATGKPSLAVVYFENNTGDPGLDHWRQALPELLVTDLSQSKYVKVLSGDEMFEILDKLGQTEARTYSAGTLKDVASHGGVNHILLGGLTKAGDSFRLDYRLKSYGSGETVGSGSVSGEGLASFFAMVDSLTRKVKEDLKLTPTEIVGDIDAELGKITTSSPEAFALYVEGREYHHKSDFAKSIELMQKAAAIDPDFAMAYRSLAMSYSNSFLDAEHDRCLEKAMSLRGRVSEKERLILEAEYYQDSEKTVPKAIDAYNRLLEIYPDDSFVRTKLAYIYLGYDVYDKAIEHGLAAIRNKERTYYPYAYLASAYEALGQPEKAKDIVDTYFRDVGDSASLRTDLADYFMFQGKFPEALAEIEKALALSPNASTIAFKRGTLFVYQGDLARAAVEFRRLLELKDSSAPLYYLFGMAQLAFLQGKFAEADSLAEQGITAMERVNEENFANIFRYVAEYALWKSGRFSEALNKAKSIREAGLAMDDLSWQRLALFIQGLVLCDQKTLDKAEAVAGELTPLCQTSLDPLDMGMADFLRGAIAFQKGNNAAAIEDLKRACGCLLHENTWMGAKHALYIDKLAEAYERAGNLDEARREYEKIIALTEGRFRFGDIYARSFYRLGRIYERQGRKPEAIEDYKKFLDLWKEADAGLPEVPDARKRLAALQGN